MSMKRWENGEYIDLTPEEEAEVKERVAAAETEDGRGSASPAVEGAGSGSGTFDSTDRGGRRRCESPRIRRVSRGDSGCCGGGVFPFDSVIISHMND